MDTSKSDDRESEAESTTQYNNNETTYNAIQPNEDTRKKDKSDNSKEKLKRFFLTTATELYNKLPTLMKNLDQQKFKKAVTKKYQKEYIATKKEKKK